MERPDSRETKFKPQAVPAENARANDDCWHPSRFGPPPNRRSTGRREQQAAEHALGGEAGKTAGAGRRAEALNLLLNDPEVALGLLKAPYKHEDSLYKAVWDKYGPEMSCQHDKKMEVLETLFDAENLPVDLYPVMLKAYPSLFRCRRGRDRFLHYADETFRNLWNDIPE